MRQNYLIAVVHVTDSMQAVRNTLVSLDNGAHGVFLINHGLSIKDLQVAYKRVRNRFPNAWIGLNLLGLNLAQVVHNNYLRASLPQDIQALWCDDVGYNEEAEPEYSVILAHRISLELQAASDGAVLFGGFAFKYKAFVKDLRLGASRLAPHVGVLTTSGPETGIPPTTEKIKLIRQGLGEEAKLAVASGMTPENVDPFLDLVDYFLVATGVSRSFSEIDPTKVRRMADKMRRQG